MISSKMKNTCTRDRGGYSSLTMLWTTCCGLQEKYPRVLLRTFHEQKDSWCIRQKWREHSRKTPASLLTAGTQVSCVGARGSYWRGGYTLYLLPTTERCLAGKGRKVNLIQPPHCGQAGEREGADVFAQNAVLYICLACGRNDKIEGSAVLNSVECVNSICGWSRMAKQPVYYCWDYILFCPTQTWRTSTSQWLI